MRAVQADPQVGPAFHAGFAASRRALQRPGLAAVVAMAGHKYLRFMIYDLRFETALFTASIDHQS
jgi:hypothetical protein